MNTYLKLRVDDLRPKTPLEYQNALKQIIQEIALLGLERGHFFEKAAFCGGTALRILYDLPRFSEDLDFTLFKPETAFKLSPYFEKVQEELSAYGFESKIESKKKILDTGIESAFIKTGTLIHLLKVVAGKDLVQGISEKQLLQIKFEVDLNPAPGFETESSVILNPIVFQLVSLSTADLFAGKMHALLFRNWKNRVKGRDFYDFVWHVKRGHELRIDYLREKMVQSGHWKKDLPFSRNDLSKVFQKRLNGLKISDAQNDVAPFIQDRSEINLWSEDFFMQIIKKLKIV